MLEVVLEVGLEVGLEVRICTLVHRCRKGGGGGLEHPNIFLDILFYI